MFYVPLHGPLNHVEMLKILTSYWFINWSVFVDSSNINIFKLIPYKQNNVYLFNWVYNYNMVLFSLVLVKNQN